MRAFVLLMVSLAFLPVTGFIAFGLCTGKPY